MKNLFINLFIKNTKFVFLFLWYTLVYTALLSRNLSLWRYPRYLFHSSTVTWLWRHFADKKGTNSTTFGIRLFLKQHASNVKLCRKMLIFKTFQSILSFIVITYLLHFAFCEVILSRHLWEFENWNEFAVWQEAFQNGQGQLSKKAVVHVWKKEDWQNVTLEVYNQKLSS